MNMDRVNKLGVASMYARVIIDRKKRDFPLGIRWPVKLFDNENGLCLHRKKGDTEADDNNMIIRSEVARINDIFLFYRLQRTPLTMDRFIRDFKNNLSKTDVVQYMSRKIRLRLKEKEIEWHTYKNQNGAVNKLKKWKKTVAFGDLHENWAYDLDAWMKKTIKSTVGNSHNARWTVHMTIKAYLRLAKRDHIHFLNPYDYFKISMVKGSWKALFLEEVRALYKLLRSGELDAVEYKVLRGFLFSCMTGLRLSDLFRVTAEWNEGGILTFVPFKTRKKNKELRVPMNDLALELFREARDETDDGDPLFRNVTDQAGNRILKTVAKKAKIVTNVHYHVARHTFITNYYAQTKDLLAAQEFAGHANIKETVKYTHTNRDELKKRMEAMNGLFTES